MRHTSRLPAPRILGIGLLAVLASCSKVKQVVNPPNPVATSISISPSTPPSLDAIGATIQLTASVLDQSGNPLAGNTVTWSSDNAAVATIDAAGLVTAVANGTATMTAQSGNLSATAPITVAQVAAMIAKTAGDQQMDKIGMTLPTALVAQVNDRLGTPMPGIGVDFAVTSGGGSLGTTTGTSDSVGQISTTWTLGTVAGTQETTAKLTADSSVAAIFQADAAPDVADSMFASAGNNQSGLINNPLADSLVVKVVDQFGNGVPGETVTFQVTGGGGAVSGTGGVTTDAAGDARASWTLGNTQGLQTVEATSTLKGSPVAFIATGSNLAITSVSPDPMVEGASATINGTGFDVTPGNNTITVDGLTATVTAATSTQLTFTVPSRSCKPANDVAVSVTVAAQTTPAVTHRLNPAAPLTLGVGQQAIVTDPNSFCFQFLPDPTGGDQYLIGVGATFDAVNTTSFSMTAEAGALTTPPMPALTGGPSLRSGRAPSAAEMAQFRFQLQQDAAETRIRDWEREHMDPARHPEMYRDLRLARARLAQAVPSVGDTLQFRVPDINSASFCTDFNAVTTVVRAVGSRGIIVTDIANPTTDSLTTADILGFMTAFDSDIYIADTTYFGAPTDLDANQHVFMVLTKEVNKFGGVAGFVASVDLVPRVTCASSDFGELFYGYVPDPTGINGTVFSRQAVVDNMLPLISHEFVHIIQQSHRITAGTQPMASWEAEGQADLGKEIVANRMFGVTPGNNNGPTTMNMPGSAGTSWFQQRFTRLSLYFGWAGGTNTVAGDTPAICSLYGHAGTGIPCLTSYFYGASWSFHRYLNDRFGPSYSGPGGVGEIGLQRDWVNNTVSSVAGLETLLGFSIDTIFPQWAAMLYADDLVPGIAPALQMTSWNLNSIYSTFANALHLRPMTQSYGAFTQNRTVRNGSTAYTLMTSAGARGALAIRVRDPADAVLGSGTKPHIWILRTQ